MRDFLTALGLVFVIEGLICAGFPGRLRRLMRTATDIGDAGMRRTGLACMVFGVVMVWVVRRLIY